MPYSAIFFIGLALVITAAIYDSDDTKSRIMALLMGPGVGMMFYGLFMGVASVL